MTHLNEDSDTRKLKRTLSSAKNQWIVSQCNELNNAFGTKAAWDTISKLKSGISKTRPASVKQMKKTDGSTCQTPKENAEVFREHFQKLYEREADYDSTVIDMIHQEAIVEGLDHEPSDEEIKEAVGKLHDSGPGDSGLCAQAWKHLERSYYYLNFVA